MVKQIARQAPSLAITGWLAGLAYYGFLATRPIHVPLWSLAILVIAGLFVVSLVVAGGLSMLAVGLTRAVTGRPGGSSGRASAAVLGTVLAFLSAKYGLTFFSH